MERLLRLLNEIKPGVDFASSSDIIEEHLLSSLEIVMLVSRLNDEFDIEVGVTDLRPENFKTVETINRLVERLQDE